MASLIQTVGDWLDGTPNDGIAPVGNTPLGVECKGEADYNDSCPRAPKEYPV
jgi:hypothetical protein